MIDERVIWDSWIPSVIGGVLAGIIVIMMELFYGVGSMDGFSVERQLQDSESFSLNGRDKSPRPRS